MPSAAERDDDKLQDTLSNLKISELDPHQADVAAEVDNPWQDEMRDTADGSEQNDLPVHEVPLPDPGTLDAAVTRGLAAEPQEDKPVQADREVILEFDPLASADERAARDAWADAEGHLPPPRINEVAAHPSNSESDPSASSTLPATPNRPSSPIPAFPALAALARSFSIPSLGSRSQRPRSLDTATAVPSPATLSSFAQQQAAPPTRETHDDRPEDRTGREAEGAETTRQRSKSKDKEKEPPPFDFQKFLDQMKSRGAEPVAKYLRSFLSNFAKRTFTVNDQVKLINDFLTFISGKMREADVWRNASEAEFDNAMEGMEKLVMNRLYEFTFTPQVARMVPPRPITTDDLEKDRVLEQRIALFGWIEPKHLDVPEGEGSEGFLTFAQQELLKINHYKAPRDKLICILNCCKVIFGLIRHLHKEEGADSFIPVLIYVVLKANPRHLLSNVEFINRFRNPAKLQSEAGYYLSSLMGAVSFIETMDHASLSNITQDEFERNVESAIQSLPSTGTHTPESATSAPPSQPPTRPITPSSSHVGEESAQPLALPGPAQTLGEDARRFLQKTGDTISKPLNAISRIFNEVLDGAEESFSYLPAPVGHHPHPGAPHSPLSAEHGAQQPVAYAPIQTPYKPRVRRPSPQTSMPGTPEDTPVRQRGPGGVPYTNLPLAIGPSHVAGAGAPQPPRFTSLAQYERELLQGQTPHVSRTPTPNLDLAGVQAEIDRAHEKAAIAARETLRQIFPTMDQEVMQWVLEANENDLGKSIEALLEMSSGS
ncbi:hypothetical protein CERSUDRAFT_112905 [Gelatoporia subvermispora B]|uniref:VPS9 domain-containing protein n=1 Tax=Ceriporiopsis subvermispora (strain B) TaxID=914234 RepID=M2RK85_CERS8|nr:hypothetical protein CERSUDRAFT_112905 [Gelatoporia subvermispora B]